LSPKAWKALQELRRASNGSMKIASGRAGYRNEHLGPLRAQPWSPHGDRQLSAQARYFPDMWDGDL